jgi:hypothetical protein
MLEAHQCIPVCRDSDMGLHAQQTFDHNVLQSQCKAIWYTLRGLKRLRGYHPWMLTDMGFDEISITHVSVCMIHFVSQDDHWIA